MRDVAVVGVGQSRFAARRPDKTLPELISEATMGALATAGISIDDVDSVVAGLAPEALQGVAHAEGWAIGELGGRGRPAMRVQTGGTTGLSAVIAGYTQIRSGFADIVLVASADRVGESGDSQNVLNKVWDPLYERSLPLAAIATLALSATRYLHRYGASEEDMARAVVKARNAAARNPHAHLRKPVSIEDVLESKLLCWPFKLLDACPQSTGACALVLAAEGSIPSLPAGRPAWITGAHSVGDTYYIGDRVGDKAESDFADAEALRRACLGAYERAGITDPSTELDVVETYASFSAIELHNIEAMGLCAPGEAASRIWSGEWDHDGRLPVNPSGGVITANPISATAMVRVAEAALQVQGCAGERQVPDANKALATGAGGSHQFFNALVLEGRA